MLRKSKVEGQSEAEVLALLRTAALRAITRKEHPEGPRQDINPHTETITTYALASMLTFDLRGDRASEDVSRLAHMIFAGGADRLEVRRDWAVWELERLGHPTAEFLHSIATHGGILVVPEGDV
jgi:hypothetical protein